ncbi:Putative flippase GtrA (transmembrane translocase of bactoprenol-linked glucose) [Corynebacterium mycetoides]|uniref:Putative flippase GtrA (Transmembrane translocase of bactoprenol-linked glucose) n=1 Tax=Corynebacterium mycetoides TaxID=38302 RepID=A0A1G9LRC9_9CORY|nr:GtrA family protein [Corynebacterium mycetoides]SDL64506.1 Putative flippase GtrA (transmembrane translocase of bactoprenol-linked glucose) [Corynebacterium mycetoides]
MPSTAVRLRASAREFVKFGIVGGSGVLVNFVVFYLAKKAIDSGLGIHESDVFVNILGTRFNVRWYHVLSTLAFVVANVWNFQLNRSWTFRHVPKRNWFAGFFPFLATGVLAFAVSLTLMTLLMNPTSPIALPEHIFDDSSGLRTKSYWAQAISTLIAMPVNFVVNKFWAFRKPRVTPI